MKKLTFYFLILSMFVFQSCGIYSFTGADTGGASTFTVDFFENTADIVEPGLDRAFTVSLQDLIQNQTSLSLTNSGGDLLYEGEINDFYDAHTSATANGRAAQNRMTITVQLCCYNKLEPDNNFDRRFSHFSDYPANTQLRSVLDTALDEIFLRITQDIFKASL